MNTDHILETEAYITDAELKKRWRCSHMRLWRLRKAGKLSKPFKPGGSGPNLTRVEEIRRIEAAA